MNITANRARTSSLVLLLAALLNHGVPQAHDLRTGQQTSGMLRLARDLMRRIGGEQSNELGARDFQRVIDQTCVRQLGVPVEGQIVRPARVTLSEIIARRR
jgi:hypothetical protein